MKHEVDTRGWPLVPCDPAAIPQGHEPVRVGWPHTGEVAASLNKSAVFWSLSYEEDLSPRLIIRPIKPPDQLPTNIVPPGWWLRKNPRGGIFISKHQPKMLSSEWYTPGEVYEVPQPIAANLPNDWLALPWDQSLIQQTRGE